jgi:hypothetical protein
MRLGYWSQESVKVEIKRVALATSHQITGANKPFPEFLGLQEQAQSDFKIGRKCRHSQEP